MAQQRTALVTGGTRGIGLAIIETLVRNGFVVWTCGRSDPDDVAHLDALGVRYVRVDFRDPRAAANALAGEPGLTVDVLVNNAGIGDVGLLEETTDELVDRMLAINLVSPILLMRAFTPQMARNGWGRVINISSISGKVGNAGRLAYASSKHGLIGATRCVSDEFAARGVTVNAVCPGPTDTAMLDEIAAGNPNFMERMRSRIAIRRILQPEEVAPIVGFLASDAAVAITGQCFVVDGGVIQS